MAGPRARFVRKAPAAAAAKGAHHDVAPAGVGEESGGESGATTTTTTMKTTTTDGPVVPSSPSMQPSLFDADEDTNTIPLALEPKVMAPFRTRAGETPRRVQIERKKRHFAQLDVDALFRATPGIAELVAAPHALPLDAFDDTDHESRASTEWLQREALESEQGLRAKVALYSRTNKTGFPIWATCSVVGGDAQLEAYHVRLDKNKKVLEGVARVDLCFDSEDPEAFAARRHAAYASRAEAVKQLHYHLFVDSMPTEDIPPLTVEQINRMLGFALNSKKLKDKLMDTSQLINEINIEYARTMNKIVFDDMLVLPSAGGGSAAAGVGLGGGGGGRGVAQGGATGGSADDVEGPADAMLVPSPAPYDVPEAAPAPEVGTVNIPEYDFPEQFSEFSFHTALTKSEAISATVKIVGECNKLMKQHLFNVYFSKSQRLEDFEQSQKQAIAGAVNTIKEGWINAIKAAILKSFQHVGKGWFNLHETSHEIHDYSKLKRFLNMTRFRMEDTLRFLVEESIEVFGDFMHKTCSPALAVKATNDVAFVSAAAAATAAAGGDVPLFALELVMTDKGAFGYSTPLDKFESTVVKIFETAVTSLHNIPQLEPAIMADMQWTSVPTMMAVHLGEPAVQATRAALVADLEHSTTNLRAYLALYDEYLPLLTMDVGKYVEELQERGEELTLQDLLNEVDAHEKHLAHVNDMVPVAITVGAFSVNTRKVKEFLAEKRAGLIEQVKLLIADFPRKICEKVNAEFKQINKQLAIKTTDPEGVKEQRELIESLPKLVAELNEVLEAAYPYFDALDKMTRPLEDDDVKLKSDAQFWPNKLQMTVKATEDELVADEKRYKEEQEAEQEGFSMHMKDLENTITNLGQLTDMDQTEAYARQMEEIDKDLKESQKQADLYNSRESLFGAEITDYTAMKKMMDTFDPFCKFWVYANSWKKWKKAWMTDPFNTLDAEGMEKDVGDAFKVMFKMGKQFTLRDMPTCASNCETVRLELEDFKKYLPLVLALRSPGMRERHWTQISEEIGIVIPHDDPEYTLSNVLEQKLPDQMDAIVKVCDVAGKEYGIETAMEKMYGEWEGADLQVMEYRETGTYVIKVEETITQMLDDHIVMAQAMSFSPFKKPFEEQITEWERTLSMVSEVLDEWITVQRSWMYLEPIFGSDDIMQQLPLEGKRFAAVDRSWRKALGSAYMTPAVLKICNDRKLLEMFRESNKMLEMVQKGLSDYLETKRLAFARFFFLSNDELLQILSQTKNPLAVQPHLRKCFEAINTLDFEDDLKIVAMNSVEKEKIPFVEHMYPEGNVENWLGEVERIMRKSCRHSIVEALKDYQEKDRPSWVKSWPAMTVLGVGCTYWTAFSEDAITNGSLPAWFDKNVEQLNDLTDMVRGKLTTQARETLGALITIDVHNRDTVTLLMDMGVKALSDFDWVCQLRYYWENDDLYVKMVQASLPFGYEYLGNQPRLVVTPLTDRCYMTLMGAMHLNLGGAPAGPAGTGKTETTKDLAKALAMQCVVFNCSDGLDYLAMAKFFKGIASSGAWACFDEFNRIKLEVLSVVAAQILTIQNAVRQKLKIFNFEDSEIGLKHCCSVFITMNPGYAGRSELPDNLKALFRPCAMMVPDYALIGEISLMSFGFKKGRPLAKKMVATFKLCSEQLSAQDHYDYGMRAVKSVITAAGNLKRDFPDEDEEVLLLRGIMDVNIPKFLAHDLPLFEGILSDLFPGVKKPDVDYGDLMDALVESCGDLKIQPVKVFLDKVIQLYETTIVRHGLMLVGPTGGGKTMIYRSLALAMTKLNVAGSELYQKAKYVVLNPKSITMGQLYGDFDEATHEWTDGVLACYMRDLAEQETPDKKWLLFDGPVDAIWIENMNTVLDDNKKLCLVSGEIIAMSATMTMMFEVEDLAVASPATVSRCGMVYVEPTSMGYEPLLDSYLQSLPDIMAPFLDKFKELFMFVMPGMEGLPFYMRKNLKETVTTVDTCLVMGMFNIMSSLLKRYQRTEGQEPLTPEDIEGAQQCAMPMWIFSIIWSVCASVTGPGRPKLDEFLRKKAADGGFAEHMPPNEKGDASMYEYCFDQDELTWKGWMDTIPPYKCNAEQAFADIIVPTADTVRYTYVMDKLLLSDKHVLCVGETGTGKTLNVMDKLSNHMPEQFVAVFMTFSARTSANQTQDFIDSKMDKRRKGVFGPPSGKKYAVLIDDLNMPLREVYFAQPPIELLRQWQDHQGWYERKPPCAFRTIQDMIIVGCMGPPGGGRNPVSNRLLRHFNFLSFTDMSDESCIRIFDTILGATLQKKFAPEVAELSGPISAATIAIYNTVRKDLLPTPAKSHYTFNLRDLARVFQGLLRADPKLVGGDKNELFGLWMHENLRVFQDRMVNNEDREWFRDLIDKTSQEKMGAGWAEVVGEGRLIYGDYLIPGADPRIYQRVRNMGQLQKVVEEALEDYNSVTNAPMKLVMFLDAIEHVSRVCRVIRLPLGNALLLGVGGSGRQSLTRLAAALEEFDLFQIEVAKGYGKNEWRDDLRKVLLMAGMEGKNVVFLFTDTQIVQENFLEDINNLLNSGEVPNLWKTEDTEAIGAALRPIMQSMGMPVTKNAVNSYFVTRVRSNMHCVLAMSPVSEEFRQRLRMFPALVNCCTIDWFSEWPLEALNSANTFLGDVPLESEELVKGVVDSCVFIHQSVERKSKEFYDVLRRFNYVTPTSYLELLQTFIRLLREKRDEIETTRSRLQIGLDKLNSTASQVAVMEKELVDLQPVLAKTSVEVEEMIVVIKADTEAADETKAKVLVQEKEANEKAAEAKAIADDAQADLDLALPALDAALASLKLLTRNDVVEVKALKNPPAGVKLVMEVACLFFAQKPKMVADTREGAKPGAKVADYWDASTKMLNDPTAFLDSLMTYDKDNISEDIIKKAEPYMSREDFTVDAIRKVSKACTSICMWATAMYTYYNVSVSVEPKRQKLAAAQASLEVTMGELAEAKATLAAVEAKLKDLNTKFSAAEKKQNELKDQVAKCTAQLDRAGKLIGGLGGEKTRWEQTVSDLTVQLHNVVGDVVVSSGVVAYNGPFTPSFRSDLLAEWSKKMKELNVPHTPGADIVSTLADPVRIRAWNIAGLPTDSVSIENGIIVAKARRWPLMIDPQGQANKWVKNMEKDTGIDVIKLTEKDYLRTLANGIRFGRAVLLENIGENLDAALEPLLQKQTFKQGGSEVIKMGDDIIPYHPDFRFYMTTKMRNPHYQPEVSVKVSLLNFFVTLDGLEDQLLGTVVMQERSDLAELKNQLVVSNARMKKELKEIEDKILYLLSNSTGNILDDEVLINTLAQSKITSNEITAKVAEAEKTEKDIDETREKYRPVATRASVLFFCISDLALVDPMYQYSLAWFISLFIRGIEEAEKSEDIEKRIEILNEYFTYSLYNNICRSLFERHKLMFSLLLTIAILQQKGQIDALEWRFLLAGPTDTNISEKNPAPEWITEKVWVEIVNLSHLAGFKGFSESFAKHVDHYRQYFESADAHRYPLDPDFVDKVNDFQKLLVIRCIRPDRFMLGTQDFIGGKIGERFIEPPPFDLQSCYSESSVTAPLIFVLSSGADPMADLLKFCDEAKMMKRFDQVSLGQGQGPKAEKLITLAMERGMWVCLQNCHLAESWMPKLDNIVENIDPERVHRDFRLWLTSMPSPHFPVAILQNGVKMTLEPPKGLKSNLVRSYTRISDQYMDECANPDAHKKLLFSICLFHAVIQDRRKFGPLGWNIRYDFTDGDLNMCQRQIKMMIDDYEDIPYKVIRVLCGEINYGGRVTDDKDRRLINNLLLNYVNPEVITDAYSFSPSGTYKIPGAQNVEEFFEFIKTMPLVPKPEIFGLHENADITCDQNETYSMFETVLSLQPRVNSGGGLSREDVIESSAKDIFDRCPPPFDIDMVAHTYPTDYNQSMNTVLVQECIRYNNLLVVMRKSLQESLKALKGLVVMSPELEGVTNSIFDNQVPEMWAAKAFPSMKPLSSWVLDLLERIKFINSWIDKGPPPVYWISGFFFPQAFLTGTLQNYARKHQIAIDTVQWNFNVQDTKTFADTKEAPDEGCYITGYFLEGARWDYETHQLAESRPKELYTDFPLMWLQPEQNRVPPTSGFYLCPAYKILTRAGTLSTTGHSTNFVMYMEVPSDKSESHWINSSVALFTALMF